MSKKLDWIIKQKYATKKDISFNRCVNKNREYVSLTMRNNVSKTIAPTGYVIFAIDGERVYFSEATEEIGYKLSDKGTSGSVSTQIYNDDFTKFIRYHAGDYNIEYDFKNKLYFVDTE